MSRAPSQNYSGLTAVIPALIASAQLSSENQRAQDDRLQRGLTVGADFLNQGFNRRFEGEQRGLDRKLNMDDLLEKIRSNKANEGIQGRNVDSEIGNRNFMQGIYGNQDAREAQAQPVNLDFTRAQTREADSRANYKSEIDPQILQGMVQAASEAPLGDIPTPTGNPSLDAAAQDLRFKNLMTQTSQFLSTRPSLNEINDFRGKIQNLNPETFPEEYRGPVAELLKSIDNTLVARQMVDTPKQGFWESLANPVYAGGGPDNYMGNIVANMGGKLVGNTINSFAGTSHPNVDSIIKQIQTYMLPTQRPQRINLGPSGMTPMEF